MVRQSTWQKSALCIQGPATKSQGSLLECYHYTEEGRGYDEGTLEESEEQTQKL